MDIEGVLAITFIFGGGTLIGLAMSPIGRALAERIRRHGAPAIPDDLRQEMDDTRTELLEEVTRLRTEVSELAERVDFTERLLAKGRDERLPSP